MRFLRVKANNFGSYQTLTWNMVELGLCHISGVTGSGKSTLQDLIPWILFGITAKNGKADEVLKWDSRQVTGQLLLEHKNTNYLVERTRGKEGNDLCFYVEGSNGVANRGTNQSETQKIINKTLQITPEIYLSAAYFNEFSTMGSFFSDNKSSRRELLASLVDLSTAEHLKQAVADKKRQSEAKIDHASIELSILSEQLKNQESQIESINTKIQNRKTDIDSKTRLLNENLNQWDSDHKASLHALEDKLLAYNTDCISKIEQLTMELETLTKIQKDCLGHCSSCGQPIQHWYDLQDQIKDCKNSMKKLQLPNSNLIMQIKLKQAEVNPYTNELVVLKTQLNNADLLSQKDNILCDITNLKNKTNSLQNQTVAYKNDLSGYKQLIEISLKLRAQLLYNVVKQLQDNTNDYLERFFNAEIRISLDTLEDDSVSLVLQKDNNECSYSQLSRGQRSMLRLCFAVSVMRAFSNRYGVYFSTLFFDEVLDGLSSELKVNAVSLLSELQKTHENVLVIDHATEIQSFFPKCFEVTIEHGNSRLNTL